MTDQNTGSAFGGIIILGLTLLIGLGLYLFFCFCCKRICEKTGQAPGALIWIPILQFIPLLRAAGMATWMFLLLLVPLVNVAVAVMMWVKICVACGKSPWLVILLFIPPINLIFFPYLAFANGRDGSVVGAPATA